MNEAAMMHGTDWHGESVAGWYMSEKLDGCRAFWDGSTLWTRSGHAVQLPANWTMPSAPLDCELYDGLDGRKRCELALKFGRFTPSMRLHVFDAPNVDGGWAERMRSVTREIKPHAHLVAVALRVCSGIDDALTTMRAIKARGGEGVMLRKPGISYVAGRSAAILKLTHEPMMEAQ